MFPTAVKIISALLAAYFLGAFPTAFLLGKLFKKIDIRQFGSGNVGATNAFRVLGKLPGVMVLLIDILKGVLCATLIAGVFEQTSLLARILLGAAAVAGHVWSVFLRFKGGKGMATSLGVLLGLAIGIPLVRPVLFLSVAVWIVVFVLSGIVSFASIISAVAFPVFTVAFCAPLELVIMSVALCVLVTLRHHSNLSRLIRREEPRVFTPFFIKR
ncbi:MAG: glycerol-3-phosphate 1-O-acyltransferase PlsY [Candidatus Omnitrophota bacterium]